MRRYLLFLLCLLALPCAASVSAWAAPTITGVCVERGRDTGSGGSVGYHEWVIVYLSDSDGLVELARVGVTDSQCQTHDAWCAKKNEEGTQAEFWWQNYGQATAPPPGTYVAQVRDQGGQLTDEVSANASEVREETPVILTPPVDGSVVHGIPEFSWSASEGVECFCLGVHEVNGPCAIWCPSLNGHPVTSPVAYDYDGAGQELVPGHLYGWHVISHVPDPVAQSDSRAYAVFAGIADGLFTIYSPLPVIRNVSMCRGYLVDQAGAESYEEHVRAVVTDFDGWEGVWVCTTTPGGGTHPAEGDCNGSFSEGPYTLNQGWGQWTEAPLQAGSFTVVGCDSDYDGSVFVTDPIPAPPSWVPTITYPENGGVIAETVPTFVWDTVAGAERIEVWVEEVSTGARIWNTWGIPGDATSVEYGGDVPLLPGHGYRLQVRPWFGDQDPSDQVVADVFAGRMIEFWVLGPEPPAIEKLEVYRGRDTSPEGQVSYHEFLRIYASDADGIGDIASVVVTDSSHQEHEARKVCDRDPTTAAYCWESYGEEDKSPAGAYAVAVTDRGGNSASLSAEVSVIPEVTPVLLNPPANYSVTPYPPLFSWSWSGPGDVDYCLGVRGVDGECAIWCGGGKVSGSTAKVSYEGPDLVQGRLYEWLVYPLIPDLEQSDPRAESWFEPIATGRFWLGPDFVGFLQPINNDGSSIFKLKSTVPVKFQLLNADGSYKSDATATLKVAFVDQGIVGDYLEAVSTARADSGNTFRYDPAANQYIFNLGTANLRNGAGTYSLQVTVDGVLAKEVLISLK